MKISTKFALMNLKESDAQCYHLIAKLKDREKSKRLNLTSMLEKKAIDNFFEYMKESIVRSEVKYATYTTIEPTAVYILLIIYSKIPSQTLKSFS